MNGPVIVAIALIVLGLIVVSRSATRVPVGTAYVVESLGRYAKTLQPGFHLITPFVETVRYRVSLAEQALPIGAEACRTRDDREVWVNGTLAFRVTDAHSALYNVADMRAAMAGVARLAVREAVAGVALDELHASRAAIEAAVVRELGPKTKPWGLEALRHEITDISRHRKETHT